MATYDPKRTRPTVHVGDDDPAPVEALLPAEPPIVDPPPGVEVVEVEVVEAEVEEPTAVAETPTEPPAEPVRVAVSPSPFEPAGPPDRRAAIAIGVVVAAAVVAGVVSWLRRRSA